MNWYLWFITVVNGLAALVYIACALKGTGFSESKKTNPVGLGLWATVGLLLLFWTTGPLNIFGWLYVSYVVLSTLVFVALSDRKLHFNVPVCVLLSAVCAMWAIVILTVGFAA